MIKRCDLENLKACAESKQICLLWSYHDILEAIDEIEARRAAMDADNNGPSIWTDEELAVMMVDPEAGADVRNLSRELLAVRNARREPRHPGSATADVMERATIAKEVQRG